ncbi:hypothetical protein ABIB27_003193 [Arthrobacter sp. UYEF21]
MGRFGHHARTACHRHTCRPVPGGAAGGSAAHQSDVRGPYPATTGFSGGRSAASSHRSRACSRPITEPGGFGGADPREGILRDVGVAGAHGFVGCRRDAEYPDRANHRVFGTHGLEVAQPLCRGRDRGPVRCPAPGQGAGDRRTGPDRGHPDQRREAPGRVGDLALVRPDHGRTPRSLLFLCGPDLAPLENSAAPAREVQVLHRPRPGVQAPGRGGPVHVPAGKRGGGEYR